MPSDYVESLYSEGKQDECWTPPAPVLTLLPLVPRNKIIWCPFDTEESHFVKVFRQHGFDVIDSHIQNGYDFLKYEPSRWDIIISNPPYTDKAKHFARAISFNKPFALLMSVTWLNDSTPKKLFRHIDLQLLLLTNRVHYLTAGGKKSLGRQTPFASAYYCRDLLPKQIIIR